MCFPYFCLSMPCALLLFVSPPLTCSQSPGLCVSLVPPVSVCPALIVLTCPSLSVACVCIYSPCFLVPRCVVVKLCLMVCSLSFHCSLCSQRLALSPCSSDYSCF